MPASQAGRNISFALLKPGVLALAVSSQHLAVSTLRAGQWKTPPSVPSMTPLWISAPGASFAETSTLPAGTHAFLSPLRKTEQSVFTLGLGQSVELRLEAATKSVADAGDVATQLTAATDLLRKMLDRDKLKPTPADLSAVLASGRFETQGTRVRGVWGIDRAFLAALAPGGAR